MSIFLQDSQTQDNSIYYLWAQTYVVSTEPWSFIPPYSRMKETRGSGGSNICVFVRVCV